MSVTFSQRAAYQQSKVMRGRTAYINLPAVVQVNGIEYVSRVPWSRGDAEHLNSKTSEFVLTAGGKL